jgi:hypothetical protein
VEASFSTTNNWVVAIRSDSERQETMRRLRRGDLIVLAILIALVVVARYLGWLSTAPPLLAPGIQ